MGEVDYEVCTPGKIKELKVYHVNLLKVWKERPQEVNLGEELGPSTGEMQTPAKEAEIGNTLSERQRQDLKALQTKFPAVFSKKPGCTNLVQHHIRVKRG